MRSLSAKTKKKSAAEVNKQINELKKKIQLSEGQRKALFEFCETDRKNNNEEIAKFKKENSDLIIRLKKYSNNVDVLEISRKEIERIVGPISKKSVKEIKHLLELQTIDRNKCIDLINYYIKKKTNALDELKEKCRELEMRKNKKEDIEKIELPTEKVICEIQNKIHAVEVQLREAEHVKNRYKNIKHTLTNDSTKFEGKIKNIEDKLAAQKNEMQKLKEVLRGAQKLKLTARQQLHDQEQAISENVKKRGREAENYKKMVAMKKSELENLEKSIYVSGKFSPRQETVGGEDVETANTNNEEESDDHFSILEQLGKIFDVLKNTTGEPTAEKTLARFSIQKETYQRLVSLKEKTEKHRVVLEKQIEEKKNILECNKFAQSKQSKNKLEESRIRKQLQTLTKKNEDYINSSKRMEEMMKSILIGIQKCYMCLNPEAILGKDPLIVLKSIKKEIEEKVGDIHVSEVEEITLPTIDEKWIPVPYVKLFCKTPALPHQGSTQTVAVALGSDEEEAIPSRAELKRQAQLVVEAKNRGKILRMQLPKKI